MSDYIGHTNGVYTRLQSKEKSDKIKRYLERKGLMAYDEIVDDGVIQIDYSTHYFIGEIENLENEVKSKFDVVTISNNSSTTQDEPTYSNETSLVISD